MDSTTTYSHERMVARPFDDALARTRAGLADEGFGVLFEIDIQATLRAKLGRSHEPYTILGACDAALADRALLAEPQLGVLLPCNVVVAVRNGADNGHAVAHDAMLGMVGNPRLDPIASEVAERLARVLASLD